MNVNRIDEILELSRQKDIGFFNEFILSNEFYGAKWLAGVGNPSPHVRLGETEPIVQGSGNSPEQAIENLWSKLQQHE